MGTSIDDAYVYRGYTGGQSAPPKQTPPAPTPPAPTPPAPMPEFKPFTHNAEDRFAQNQPLKAVANQSSWAALLVAGAGAAVGLHRLSLPADRQLGTKHVPTPPYGMDRAARASIRKLKPAMGSLSGLIPSERRLVTTRV